MTEQEKMACSQALGDQCWMECEANLLDIERIAKTGFPRTQRDVTLIKAVMHVAAGQVHHNIAQRQANLES